MTWKDIYRHLKQHGYDAYSPGQHKGNCLSPYIVIKAEGASLNHSFQIRTYELLLYYPKDRYSEFEEWIENVRECVADLFPRLILIDDEQPHFLDNDVSAYMTSLLYKTARKENTVNRYN